MIIPAGQPSLSAPQVGILKIQVWPPRFARFTSLYLEMAAHAYYQGYPMIYIPLSLHSPDHYTQLIMRQTSLSSSWFLNRHGPPSPSQFYMGPGGSSVAEELLGLQQELFAAMSQELDRSFTPHLPPLQALTLGSRLKTSNSHPIKWVLVNCTKSHAALTVLSLQCFSYDSPEAHAFDHLKRSLNAPRRISYHTEHPARFHAGQANISRRGTETSPFYDSTCCPFGASRSFTPPCLCLGSHTNEGSKRASGSLFVQLVSSHAHSVVGLLAERPFIPNRAMLRPRLHSPTSGQYKHTST